MTLWFSVSAVGPELATARGLSGAETAWLTNAVQLGFVVGALLSARFTVPDVIKPRYLFSASALVGAVATVIIGGTGAIPRVHAVDTRRHFGENPCFTVLLKFQNISV